MKTHLSSFQVTLILVVLLISSSIIFLPAVLFQKSGNDAWITSIAIFSVIVVYSPIYLILLKRMGRKDILEFSRQVLGKKMALLIGLVLAAYCILSAGIVCREVTEIVITDYLPETPLWYFNLSILAVSILFVYYGIEVIARSIEVSIYLFLVTLFIIIILSIGEWDFSNFLPILAEGYKPVFAGIPLGLLFFGEIVLILIFAPKLTVLGDRYKIFYISLLLTGVLFITIMLTILLSFGDTFAGNLTFPLLSLARYIEVFNILERIDPIFMFYWVGGGIFKVAIFLYGGVFIMRRILKAERNMVIIPILALISFYFAQFYFQNNLEIISFIKKLIPVYLLIQFAIPLLLLIISLIRGITNE